MNQKCINPDEIQEGDWVAYLHGEASAQVARHVARCAYCAGQIEQLRMVDAHLLAAFYRESCPGAEALADLALGRLPAPEKLRIMAHVRRCPACAAELDSVRDLTAEPPSLLDRLRQSLALALDIRPKMTLSPAALRGSLWQGRFETGGWIITLSVQDRAMTGRLRNKSAASLRGHAWLLDREATAETPIPHSRVDEQGRFRFTGLRAGAYDLLLQIGAQDVAVGVIPVE